MRMESDEFDFLAPAYVRGFLASYARFLELPVEPITEEFDRRFGTGKVETAQILAIDKRGGNGVPRERKIGPFAVILFGGAALLLLFAIVGILADGDGGGNGRQVASRQSPSPTPTPTPTPTPPVTTSWRRGISSSSRSSRTTKVGWTSISTAIPSSSRRRSRPARAVSLRRRRR